MQRGVLKLLSTMYLKVISSVLKMFLGSVPMFLLFNSAMQENVSCIWACQAARNKGSIFVWENCCLWAMLSDNVEPNSRLKLEVWILAWLHWNSFWSRADLTSEIGEMLLLQVTQKSFCIYIFSKLSHWNCPVLNWCNTRETSCRLLTRQLHQHSRWTSKPDAQSRTKSCYNDDKKNAGCPY